MFIKEKEKIELYDEHRNAVVLAIHPILANELKIMKFEMEKLGGLPTEGGFTSYSEIIGRQIRLMREKKENKDLMQYISDSEISIKNPIMHNSEKGVIPCIPLEVFKKVFISLIALNKMKDEQQVRFELTKIKGIKKNEIKFLY
jgi:hypothetical protein